MALLDLEVGFVFVVDFETSEIALKKVIVVFELRERGDAGRHEKSGTSYFGFKVDVVRVVVLPSFLPEALYFAHFDLCIDAVGRLAGIELADLLLESICFDEALRFPDFFAVA